MKHNLIMATGNANKIIEINQILKDAAFTVESMADVGYKDDIEETGETLEENALIKARAVHERFSLDVFSEDTGLEVEALDGAPGVYSARYSGSAKNADDNMNLLLKNLKEFKNRNARFRTCIALILDGKEMLFEGKVEGHIAEKKQGTRGFGYDPIFVPNGYDESFAQLDASVKNQISHRKRAIEELVKFLEKR